MSERHIEALEPVMSKESMSHFFFRVPSKPILAVILAAAMIHVPAPHARSEALTPYPLDICIVSGDKLGSDAVVFTYQGHEIKTCCPNCIDEFYKDPSGFLAKIEEAAKKASR
jgi:hypothetical protein